ncbi:S9 family peptidase [Flavobacterium psychrophilum]|uniref:S9 family peptidase n=1 Tax=Flavobacterium psychrophilum TaxID=96345 RepID=UPI00141302F5|nr:prolyl oligopeptidase family serine peptidase [Flavobacterium psychrophilum]EKT2072639.1 prolyl oligopeptidase family serine peptidase [Flavobacterium psychrophilum]EKT4492152.1 prolyl oligopeptidase family serine peptidase [Flavobacterium psychrophilum]
MSAVQIWLSEDLTIPPTDKKEEVINAATWISWNTDEQKLVTVEEEEHKNAVLTGNDDNVLLYSFTELTPFYKYGGEYIAIYIKNLKTGTKTLLSPKQTRIENQVMVSPGGKYVVYFKDKNWWIYNIELQQHKCITLGMPLPIHRLDYDRPNLIPPYGSPGWTKNDENIIIYDQFDIWLIKPDGTSRKRITNGKPTGTTYRVHENRLKQSPRYTFFGFQTQVFDFNKMVMLTTENSTTLGEGFVTYHDGNLKQLFKKESKVHFIATSKNQKEHLFLESNFELPPRLFNLSSEGKETEIKQSNPQQKDFFWGKSTLINYKNKEGKNLRGALFYPANYDVSKKYPMVVCIYEKKAQEVLDYNSPSIYSDHGFNNTNYTTEGYFVLYPNIAYGINTTGDDALQCVNAAVDEALITASIDCNALALIGHSFGGFEAVYIMGHTTIFKTAIIGAPMIDLVSAYLTTDGHGMSNMWRFEFDQFRMLATFDSDVFENNTPLKNVKNITAPLLLWTGTDDKQLDWKHSMKLQSALWRLGKKSTMLVYPNEDHVIANKPNQFDLTLKCKEWLEFYLKDQPKQEWMGKQ